MNSTFFTSIRQARDAFRSEPQPAADVTQLASEITALTKKKGPGNPVKPPSAPETAQQQLRERGTDASLEKIAEALNHTQRQRAADMERRRYFMQITVSLIVLVAGFALLGMGELGQSSQKIVAGFIGTVLGYWLR